MRLGTVGWARHSGMGQILFDFLKHLPVRGALLYDFKEDLRRQIEVPTHVLDKEDPRASMEKFIDDVRPDVILSWEESKEEFADLYARKGIRWIHGVNWDVFDDRDPDFWKKATLISPNRVCQKNLEGLGLSSTFLPMPVDTDRFPFRLRDYACRFLTIYRMGTYSRRAIEDIVAGWRIMPSPQKLFISAHIPLYPDPAFPESVKLRVEVFKEPGEVYELGDVLVQPSRFEGIGLTLLEAQSSGLPVITVDAEPMRDLAPDLLLPLLRTGGGWNCGRRMALNYFSPSDLARQVFSLQRIRIRDLSRKARLRVEKEYSWNVLRERWIDFVSRP